MKTGTALCGPRGMAASRRAINARGRGPGLSVRISIAFMVRLSVFSLYRLDPRAPTAESRDLCRWGRSKLHVLPAVQAEVAGQTLEPIRFVDAVGPEACQRLRREW